MKKMSPVAIASAVAGALSLLASPVLAQTKGGAEGMKYHCWGAAKAGQNDCASSAGTHSCAGMSKTDYDLSTWKGTKDAAECVALGGSDKAGTGVNTKIKK